MNLQARRIMLSCFSQAASEWCWTTHHRWFPYCRETANRMVTKCRKAGIKDVRRVGGVFGYSDHHWVEDTLTGDIYDPTAQQFGRFWGGDTNGLVPVGTKRHAKYFEVPEELYYMTPGAPSHKRWSKTIPRAKVILAAGEPLEIHKGENRQEWRIDKKGRKYLFVEWEVRLGVLEENKPRCALVFFNEKTSSIAIYPLYQRRYIHHKRGRSYVPVTNGPKVVVLKNGHPMKKVDGKLVNIEDYNNDPSWWIFTTIDDILRKEAGLSSWYDEWSEKKYGPNHNDNEDQDYEEPF